MKRTLSIFYLLLLSVLTIAQVNHVDKTGQGTTFLSPAEILDLVRPEISDSLQSLYASTYINFESQPIQTTTSTTFQTAISSSTPIIPSGNYKVILCYGWNHDNLSSDFESRILVNGNALGVMSSGSVHRNEPKDVAGAVGNQYPGTGTDQGYPFSRVFYFSNPTATIIPVLLEYRSTSAGDESSLWGISIEIIKLPS